MTKQKNGWPVFRIMGRTGAARYTPSRIADEYGRVLAFNVERISIEEYDEMRWYPHIRMALALMKMPILQAEWSVHCQSEDIASFVREALSEVWTPLVKGLMLAFDFGHVVMERLFEMRYNVAITRTLAASKDAITVVYPRALFYRGFQELDPRYYYLLAHEDDSSFAGVRQFVGEDAIIPEEKLVYHGNDVEYGELYGKPATKGAYPFWFFAKVIHELAAMHYELYADPVKVVYAPPGQMEAGVDEDGNPVYIDNLQYALDRLEEMRSLSSTVFPNVFDPATNQRLWSVDIIESGKTGIEYTQYLEYLNKQMLRAMFVPQLAVDSGDSGTYNLGVGQINLFLIMLEAKAKEIFDVINRAVVAPLVRWNFGRDAPRCEVRHAPLRPQVTDAVSRILAETLMRGEPVPVSASEEGGVIFMEPDWARIAEMGGLPVKWLKQADVEKIRQAAQPAAPPGATPGATPGPPPMPTGAGAPFGGGGAAIGGLGAGAPPPGKPQLSLSEVTRFLEAAAQNRKDWCGVDRPKSEAGPSPPASGWRMVDGVPVYVESLDSGEGET